MNVGVAKIVGGGFNRWDGRREGESEYIRKVRTPDGKVSSVYVDGGEISAERLEPFVRQQALMWND